MTATFNHKNDTTRAALLARRRSLFWRIHFWAALIASPFALIATLTGMLYIFTPQIEAVLYAQLDRVAPGGTMRALDDAVAAAQAAAPAGARVLSVIPPQEPHETVKVNFAPAAIAHVAPSAPSAPSAPAAPAAPAGHGGHHSAPGGGVATALPAFGLPANAVVVHVNPYTGVVTGSLVDQERFRVWSRMLHSRLLQGESWRWMIELAASWLMVMLLTGIWLWWPRSGAGLLPQTAATGRRAWRQWHALVGVALSVMSLAILTTGLTWSKVAGDQIRSVRHAIGQASPPMPRHLRSVPQEGVAPMGWQAAWERVRRHAPDIAVQLTPPRGPEGVWRASAADASQPTKRFDLQLDAYSGAVLYYAGWDRQTAFGKATAIGIPFHRGEFGWWNQALLLVFGSGVLFSLVSGWVMFFKRWRKGASALPTLLPGAWRAVSVSMVLVTIVLCVAMPLLALSAAGVALIEVAMRVMARGKPAGKPAV